MGVRTPLVALFEAEIARLGSQNRLALLLNVPAPYVFRWRHDDHLPELWRAPVLAARLGLTEAAFEQLWLESARLISRAHQPANPQPGAVAPVAVPSRKRRRALRQLGAVALTAGSLWLAAPPRVDAARLITPALRDSVASRRKAA